MDVFILFFVSDVSAAPFRSYLSTEKVTKQWQLDCLEFLIISCICFFLLPQAADDGVTLQSKPCWGSFSDEWGCRKKHVCIWKNHFSLHKRCVCGRKWTGDNVLCNSQSVFGLEQMNYCLYTNLLLLASKTSVNVHLWYKLEGEKTHLTIKCTIIKDEHISFQNI